jgi:hypothetical protein
MSASHKIYLTKADVNMKHRTDFERVNYTTKPEEIVILKTA